VIHYHGTPISPVARLYELAGAHFCVSYMAPKDVKRCHEIGQSVMLDNGAFSVWKRGATPDWHGYYKWSDQWLDCPTTWAIIPDIVEADEGAQDALIEEWPHGFQGSPVWHLHESCDRLLRLIDHWPRVCMGSSAQYSVPLSDPWRRRMDEAWNAIAAKNARTPYIHMLRGMACSGERWPFASVDSTDIARNHNRPQNTPRAMRDRWDAVQCPINWSPAPQQMELIA
jgi:hypothetical protein